MYLTRKFKSLKFHVKEFLFKRYSIPPKKQERISKALFKRFLPMDPIIIDCGAHTGKDSLALANMFRNGQVHAFEAAPKIFAQLKSRKSKWDNLYVYNVALADQNGGLDFYLSEGKSDGSSSLLLPKTHLTDHPGTFFKEVIKVSAITLDDWASNFNIPRVDLLWLDMQGYELKMLQASRHILNTVSVIHTEVSVKETYEGVGQYETLKSFLENEGFYVAMEAVPDGWDMGNVLFVREKLK